MAKHLSWLHACKSSQLKAIATATGMNSGGTKSFLTSQLLQHLPHGYFNHDAAKCSTKPTYDIISIDMGIRNLAYCRLWSPEPPPSKKSDSSSRNETPIITEWARLAISRPTSKSNGPKETKTKEPFDPATYSYHAYTLITTLLSHSPTPPTHILIERQRFRSMGGSAVQEWTLRVNMFEAMLYAVLETLSQTGTWQGKVYPVAPSKVAKFWLGEKEGADGDDVGKGAKSARTKTAKVELVRKWLQGWQAGRGIFKLEVEAEELGRAYLRKREGRRRVQVKKVETEESSGGATARTEMGKLDDLADCLLQGMAWIKWEQNRRLLMSNGVEALDAMG